MTDTSLPCGWAPADDKLYRDYHDTEWGVPERDSRALWEKLMLDGMQAGLSWITILRKRDTIREEFDDFVPERLISWDQARIDRALTNPGIIRSPQKIKALLGNARAYLEMAEVGEDFADWCWTWVGGTPIQNQWADWRDAPTNTPLSTDISKALKARGFKYVGPTIVYAWMQAVGIVNDHQVDCPRYKAVQNMV